MFCDEVIGKVYVGQPLSDSDVGLFGYLDFFRDLSYHCTEGYRLVLETDHYVMCLSVGGVELMPKNEFKANEGEAFEDGIENFGDGEPPVVSLETTLFVGERLISVTPKDGLFLLRFDDFDLKLIPHNYDDETVSGLDFFKFYRVHGFDRHLERQCPFCGGKGEILLVDHGDFAVRCQGCKKGTLPHWEITKVIDAWNDGFLKNDFSDVVIDE